MTRKDWKANQTVGDILRMCFRHKYAETEKRSSSGRNENLRTKAEVETEFQGSVEGGPAAGRTTGSFGLGKHKGRT